MVHRYITFIILLTSCSSVVKAGKWNLRDQALYYSDTPIQTNFKITQNDLEKEGGPLFWDRINDSQSYTALKIISESGEIELWLIDNKAPKVAHLVDSFSTNMSIKWISDGALIAQRSRMGSSISYIFDIKSLKLIERSKRLSNLIFFDEVNKIGLELIPAYNAGFTHKVDFKNVKSGIVEYSSNVKIPTKFASDALLKINKVVKNECEFSIFTKEKKIKLTAPEVVCSK